MLPEVFRKRMQLQLGTEYEAFAESLEGERYRALRINPLKGGAGPSKARERFLALSPWQLEPVPWEADGFYYALAVSDRQFGQGAGEARRVESFDRQFGQGAGEARRVESFDRQFGQGAGEAGRVESFDRQFGQGAGEAGRVESFDRQFGQGAADGPDPAGPGKHPYHDAGVYYIQEPSAMAPVVFLGAEPGEKVLDLCAAPGGKTTQIAGKMQGKGLLVSNEIHPQRARILSENVERLGIRNCLVLNEPPQRLAEFFPGYFDRILVDAPCSGEGMFRKNENAGEEWSPENVEQCAARQDGILDCAVAMLRPGGRLVYSTCTFAPQEDEGSIGRLISRHPEMEILDPALCLDESGRAESETSGERGRRGTAKEAALGEKESHATVKEAALGEKEGHATVKEAALGEQESHATAKEAALGEKEGHATAKAAVLGERESYGDGRTSGPVVGECLAAWGFAPGRPDWVEGVKSGAEQGADSGTRPPVPGIENTLRLWPHRLRGEGHYLAVLQKGGVYTQGEIRSLYGTERGISEKDCREYLDFAADTLTERPEGIYLRFGEQLYLAPKDMPALKGLHVLRPGLHLGTMKKNRFEPSHALALALSAGEVRRCCPVDGPKAKKPCAAAADAYIQGQTFPFAGEKGWYLITVDGYSLGWGKLAGGIMKNHYPKGLRKT